MSEQVMFWIAALAPLVLPLCAPGAKWLAAVIALLMAAILAFGTWPPVDMWTGFLAYIASAALLAGVALRIMLGFVYRLWSGR